MTKTCSATLLIGERFVGGNGVHAPLMCSIPKPHENHRTDDGHHVFTWVSVEGMAVPEGGILISVNPLPQADHGLGEQAMQIVQREAWAQGYAAGSLDMDNGIAWHSPERWRNPYERPHHHDMTRGK